MLNCRSNIHEKEQFYQSLIRQQKNAFFLNDAQKILKQGLAEKLQVKNMITQQDFQLEFISGGIIQLYSYWLNNNHGTKLDDLLTVFNHQDNLIWNQLM